MIFITENKNSKIANMVSNDFPKVTILEPSDKDIMSKLDTGDSVYVDSEIDFENLQEIILILQVCSIEYKEITQTPKGYNFK